MGVKVVFLEPVVQEGKVYEKDKEYTLDEKLAKSLGDSVKVSGKASKEAESNDPDDQKEDKQVKGPQVNKMVKEPSTKK